MQRKNEIYAQIEYAEGILPSRDNTITRKNIFLCTNSVDNFVNKNLNQQLTPLQTRDLLFCSKFRLLKTVKNHQVDDIAKNPCGVKNCARARLCPCA